MVSRIQNGSHMNHMAVKCFEIQLSGETLDKFRRRIRSALMTLKLVGGNGVLMPDFAFDSEDESLKSLNDKGEEVIDKDKMEARSESTAEEFATMMFLYKAEERKFQDRLLLYEQADKDGNGVLFPKMMATAYEVYMLHQQRQAKKGGSK